MTITLPLTQTNSEASITLADGTVIHFPSSGATISFDSPVTSIGIDISNYYTKEEIDELLDGKVSFDESTNQ